MTQVSSPTWHVLHFQMTSPYENVFEHTRCGARADSSSSAAAAPRALSASHVSSRAASEDPVFEWR